MLRFAIANSATCLLYLVLLGASQLGGFRLIHADDLVEKRQLEHEDYAKWKTIPSTIISNNGDWIGFVEKPGKGDGVLHIRHNRSDQVFEIARGQNARFSYDNQFVFYVVTPDAELIKKLKKEKKKAEELPKPFLEIMELSTGARRRVEGVSRFSLPEKASGWIAFTIDPPNSEKAQKKTSTITEQYKVGPQGLQRPKAKSEPETQPAKKEQPTKEKQPAPKKSNQSKKKPNKTPPKKESKESKAKKKTNGKTLVLLDTHSSEEFRFPWVLQFRFAENGSLIAFSTSGPQPEDDGVGVFDLKTRQRIQLAVGKGDYGVPAVNKQGNQVAFLTNRDDYDHEHSSWSVYLWSKKQKQAAKIADHTTAGVPEKWWISGSVAPRFSEDNVSLAIQTRPMSEERLAPKKDKATDDEKEAKLDIWHWQDPFLQPQQKLMAERERNRSYLALIDLKTKKMVQIADKEIPNVSFDPRSKSPYLVGNSPNHYDKMRSWDYPGYNDYYLIHRTTGVKYPIARKTSGSPQLSPAGQYVSWWDGTKRTWFALSVSEVLKNKDANPVDLGKDIPFPLFNELHDQPSTPRSYRSAGWLNNDKAFLVYDRWDIWQVDPSGKSKPINVTGSFGRTNQVELRRINLDPEARFVDLQQNMLLSGLDHKTKASGFLKLESGPEPKVSKLIWLDENLAGLVKARKSQDILFTRSTFRRFPDLWSSDLGNLIAKSKGGKKPFASIRRLSKANPQQQEYTWGTAELVRWDSKQGQPLDGILYKPEGFDPAKKYPMVVYFYERYSDRLHSYYAPAAGRSTINFSFYVSRGYLVFIPDIPYRVGAPGPSAVDAILPGVENLIAKGFVDRERIGMQGHSWGGYQTAYLVTQTNLFACAESGAPVSNMTSAYGGIRWGSGMSRMFQYEKTQSRIGDTLWNAREKYIANSPLFFADRIQTPLLILHNDKDTAVPWYQGIELFVALRRLNKPAWMLNYNDDPHWVMGEENRMDFAKRMQQFFDHYLKGDPMPVWMAKGIPAVDKGKKFGFEPAKQQGSKSEAR